MYSSVLIIIKLFADQYNYVTSISFKGLLKLLTSLVSCFNASSNTFHIFGARYRQDLKPCFVELSLG